MIEDPVFVLIVRSIVIASAVEQMLEYGEIKFANI